MLSNRTHRALGSRLAALDAVDNVTSDFDVVILNRLVSQSSGLIESMGTYSKLANLSIVDTQNLILFRGTQAESRDEVENEQDDAGSEEGVGSSRYRVGKLVSQLDIVMIDPAAGNRGSTIQVRYVITGKEVSKYFSTFTKGQETHAAKSPVSRLPTRPPTP